MLTGIQIQLWPLKHIVALEQDFLKDTDMEASGWYQWDVGIRDQEIAVFSSTI